MATDITVLIVDDSLLIRELMQEIISDIPGMSVAGTASGGKEALQKLKSAKPDVVTLDVQMPGMDGLETLDKILATQPTPVIMVSATTQLGATNTLQALEQGAMDYIAKPEGLREAHTTLKNELARKIRSVHGADLDKVLEMRRKRAAARKARQAAQANAPKTQLNKSTASNSASRTESLFAGISVEDKCIAIGISTGGPPALAAMFETLSGELPPIVIVQHMPGNFTKSFASRLDMISQLTVKEAATGDILKPGHAYVAQGGNHVRIHRNGKSGGKLEVFHDEPVSGHRPSADVMMESAARVYGNRCLGIIMTGMGHDGSAGCSNIRKSGGYVLGQDEASSDVYGMNKVAFTDGNVDAQFSLENASGMISKQVKRLWGPATVNA
ncbi:MAG: chemotaxis response regulator protein-glutamate methylesterase [Blastopirellula sp.]|nr:MAG: chemotaxis response regulator protein-glutamate methylesterase [Blastopirellula sp.]